MNPAAAALEERLHTAYLEQLRHYERALAIVENPQHVTTTSAGADWVHDLNAELHKLAVLNAAMADDKRAWGQFGQRPGPALQALLELLTQRIRQLSQGVDRHVADMQARQQNLLPEIDDFIRERRMLQAYGRR